MVQLAQLKKTLIIHNQTGDTIVEVLICMVLIAFILTGAFITSNNSFLAIKSAQQRITALGIAQGQIEALRAQAGSFTSGSPYIASSSPFCFLNDGSGTINGTSINPDNTVASTCTSDNIYHYAVICTGKSLLSQQNPSNTNPTYNFEIIVTWVGVSANDRNTGTSDNARLSMYYRTEI